MAESQTSMNKPKLIAFLATSLAPVVYLIVRFNLFQTKTMFQLNLWSVIAIIILGSVLSVIGYYCVAALKTKYYWWKQIVSGFVKVIVPLLIAYAGVSWLADNIKMLQEFLLITLACEAVAIVVNPFPKWCFDNNIEGLVEISDKIFHREVKE